MNKSHVYTINNLAGVSNDEFELIKKEILSFIEDHKPIENSIYLFSDNRTDATYIEVHIDANSLLNESTIDVPLDPDEQEEYRANRSIDENSIDFKNMMNDAKKCRGFSNIVAEYTDTFNPAEPLKIIAGQHRYTAIKYAQEEGINEYHGLKVYFNLDLDQRMDVQLISNTNIDVSPDLLDRIFETSTGPELRNWCQTVGLLGEGKDFSDKKQPDAAVTVRFARTFVLNFYNGTHIDSKDFSDEETTPVMAKTGVRDIDWENFKDENPDWNTNKDLINAGKEFVELSQSQKDYFDKSDGKKRKAASYANVTYNYSVVSAWAYISGCLQKNEPRLIRHYSLKGTSNHDPLNAYELSQGRHNTDSEKYRGIATRYGVKERGRMTELFFYQAEKGEGIKKGTVEIAITSYHKKLADLELKKLKEKYK